MNAKHVMCIANGGNEASLTLRRVYKVIPDEKAERRKMIKILDDTEGEYWFPASCFVAVELQTEQSQGTGTLVWLDKSKGIGAYLNTWSGHTLVNVTVLEETPKRYRVRLEQDATRPNGHYVTAGTVTYVPKDDVAFVY
jgi:hypothetical protein